LVCVLWFSAGFQCWAFAGGVDAGFAGSRFLLSVVVLLLVVPVGSLSASRFVSWFPSGGSPKAGGACSPEPPAMRIANAKRVTTPITRRTFTSPVWPFAANASFLPPRRSRALCRQREFRRAVVTRNRTRGHGSFASNAHFPRLLRPGRNLRLRPASRSAGAVNPARN
jgi:hypothetical protein